MKKTNKKGFTLVELLVVIAIIAILSVVSIVGYTSFTKRAKESNASTELAQVSTYMYAAAAMPESGITFNSTNSALIVEVDKAAEQSTAAGYALGVIKKSIDDSNAAGNVRLLAVVSADFAAGGTEDSSDKVTIHSLYYVSKDGVVAQWDIANNKFIIPTGTLTLVSSAIIPS